MTNEIEKIRHENNIEMTGLIVIKPLKHSEQS